MEKLAKLLKTYAKRGKAQWWVGSRPSVREGQVARTIAAQIGYPTSKFDPFAKGGMLSLTNKQATHVLAVAGTTSLAYGPYSPRQSDIKNAAEALEDMTGEVTFLSNGLWDRNDAPSWNPLTSATFDCGLIGYNASHAFIFWVEEED